jgi:phage/plasmid-like protein (TIGR03299 family)
VAAVHIERYGHIDLRPAFPFPEETNAFSDLNQKSVFSAGHPLMVVIGCNWHVWHARQGRLDRVFGVALLMPHNIDSMAYYGDPPWHGLGTRVPARATAAQMIGAAGLDWQVKKKPIPNVGAGAKDESRRFQLIRMPRNGSESEVPLGVVGPRYLPLQNSAAFEFFDPIVGEQKAVFETAGSLGNGERVWVLARTPGEIRVIGDDCCSKFLLLSNAHDGRGSVMVKFTPIRVVCQNTLLLAIESGEKGHRVRHSTNMQDRLREVQDLLTVMWQTFQAAETLFQSLAKVQVDTARLDTFLQAVYPLTEQQRKEHTRPERWNHITILYERGDSPALRPSHTLWGAYNAVTRYEDYRIANEAGPDRGLNRVWFGHGADVKLRALQMADSLRQHWVN